MLFYSYLQRYVASKMVKIIMDQFLFVSVDTKIADDGSVWKWFVDGSAVPC